MTDSNEDVKENGPFQDFIHDSNMVDAVKYQNPIHAATKPTYVRSKNRIDYILVSKDLPPAIVTAGHDGFHELIQTSDHLGIYLSIVHCSLIPMQLILLILLTAGFNFTKELV